MALSLIDLVRSEFKTSRASDEMNSRMQGYLKLPHRYGPARLAIGRSLGIASEPALEINHLGFGKPIKGEHLFGQGEELATWVTLLVEHSGQSELDRRDLQNLVAAHWQRGITMLWDDWKAAGSDFDKFVSRLVRHAESKGRAKIEA